jgi:hypothetical protein
MRIADSKFHISLKNLLSPGACLREAASAKAGERITHP